MKVEKAPLESYADVGGLHEQIQELKESVEVRFSFFILFFFSFFFKLIFFIIFVASSYTP